MPDRTTDVLLIGGGIASASAAAELRHAAGHVCEYDSRLHGRSVRIEHEHVAAAQVRLAARNMLGGHEPFADVPYFWSDLADWLTMEYVGLGGPWDHTQTDACHGERRFAVRYLRDRRLVGVCSIAGAADLDAARTELAVNAAAATPAQRRAA